MQQIEELTGTVERIIYENAQTGFVIFVISNKNTSAIIKSCTPTLRAGQEIRALGTWIVHPKFGKQFHAQQCLITIPTSALGIQKYLASGIIKGIGPTYAEKIVQKFGEKTLDIIDQHPQKILCISGLGPKRIQAIINSWKEHKEVANIMVFLQEKGISPTYATKIFKRYGNQAISIVQENPYRLAQDIWGIGFKMADRIAQNIGFDLQSPARIQAGIIYAIQEKIGQGHLYVHADQLKKTTQTLLELPDTTQKLLVPAIQELCNARTLQLLTHNDQHLITLTNIYKCEYGVAQYLHKLLTYPSGIKIDIQKTYERIRVQKGYIQLNDDQQRAIITALSHKITIVTGGPGTGKTTLIKQLLEILDNANIRYKLAAPTGRAAQRITESTRHNAYTIHRLLEFDPKNMQFKHNERHTLNLDMLIVDEASMIDIFLASALLKALPLSTHILFIGDIDQLPPVGAGNFLKDLIKSTIFSCIRLTEIFRQAHNSLIITNAHRVNQGMFPSTRLPNTIKDFLWIREEDATNIFRHLTTIFQHQLALHNLTAQDALVLTPMNRGSCGTHQLNSFLQHLINNTNQPSISYGLTTFKKADRVMQIRNNYEKFVFNGDIGSIQEINIDEQTVTVIYAERQVTYQINELDELVLAYATTVHKSQGSEYPVVIIPLFTQHFMLLARNLLYTAITRAKKLCILIGQPKAIAIAVKNNKSFERLTLLNDFLIKETVWATYQEPGTSS